MELLLPPAPPAALAVRPPLPPAEEDDDDPRRRLRELGARDTAPAREEEDVDEESLARPEPTPLLEPEGSTEALACEGSCRA